MLYLIVTSAITLHFMIVIPVLFCVLSEVMVLSVGIVTGSVMSMVPAVFRNTNEQAKTYDLAAQFGNIGVMIRPPSFAAMTGLLGVQGLIILVLVFCFFGGSFSLLARRLKNNAVTL